MKKFFVTAFCLIALSASAIPAAAQTRGRRCNPNVQSGRVYSERGYRVYNNQVYNGGQYDVYRDGRYDNRSFWEKHRDKITTAGGAGVGALLGGIGGGKKGAIIGAIAGGGGAGLYTYGIRDRNNRRGY
jgi:hypothetical protein